MALSTNVALPIIRPELGIQVPVVVAAATTIYKGAIVSLDANGNLVNASSTLPCFGISEGYYTAGQTAMVRFNHITRLTISSAVITDLLDLVYATDSNTLTRTPNTCIVGRIIKIVDSSTVEVWIRNGAA